MMFSFRTLATGLVLLCIFSSCEKESVNTPPVVDAGNDRVLTLPVDTVNLSGTATDADGKLVSYLWSEVSGPAIAKIASPGLPSTLISGLVPGRYVFQLFVTDDKGGTGTDTVGVMVKPAISDTLVLQQHQNFNELSVWGNDSNLEGTFPNSKEIGASTWTFNGSIVGMRAILKFDLSKIPATSNIQSARLTLFSNPTPTNGDLVHANSGPDNTMLIQQITSPWETSAVRWKNQPSSTTTNQVVVPSTPAPFLDLVDVDVTTLVSNMVKNNANLGFSLRLQTEAVYNSRIFCSSKFPNAEKHPRLVVVYLNGR